MSMGNAMELRNYIEEGIAKAGGTSALASILTVKPQQVTDTKSMRISLPVPACYALADLIEKNASEIIAASELVTEKKPERRALLLRYLAKISSTAAGVALIVGATLPDTAHANGVDLQQSIGSNFQKFRKSGEEARSLIFTGEVLSLSIF